MTPLVDLSSIEIEDCCTACLIPIGRRFLTHFTQDQTALCRWCLDKHEEEQDTDDDEE